MSVTESSIRQDVYSSIYTLLNDNKPDGWSVFSAYPEDNPTFPCMIINPANISIEHLSLGDPTTGVREIPVIVTLEFYDKAKEGKESVDSGADNAQNTITSNNITDLYFQGWEDGDADNFIEGNEKINYKTAEVRFKHKR